MYLPVRRLEDDAGLGICQVGKLVEDRAELIAGHRALLACVEDAHQPVSAEIFDQVDHHGQATLHIGGTQAVQAVTVDSRSDVALEWHRVRVAGQDHPSFPWLAYGKGVFNEPDGVSRQSIGDCIPDRPLVPGLGWDVHQPGQRFGQRRHPGKVTVGHYSPYP